MGRDTWIIAGISVAWIGLACAGYWFLGNGAENFERASELTRIDGYITQYEAAKQNDKKDLACMLAMTIEMSYIYIREREPREHWRDVVQQECTGLAGKPSDADKTVHDDNTVSN
ncbi:hypothetical protein [Cupriavidus alkaliphilus]|uniref:hypothetical protein n=1 Tax=Cupriavidus alkaliphilus TaxID=942866 RepID=UPI000DC41165|nr:hypothetical protein [Cupriavidus alkaliphilus]MBB3016132.1 hypothetical protein [Cupriavidus alkaliphilus]RAS09248.1 hypothetical protein C7415_10480 [Cupriavidus alkaliphilus]